MQFRSERRGGRKAAPLKFSHTEGRTEIMTFLKQAEASKQLRNGNETNQLAQSRNDVEGEKRPQGDSNRLWTLAIKGLLPVSKRKGNELH